MLKELNQYNKKSQRKRTGQNAREIKGKQALKGRDNPIWSHSTQALGQSLWINLDIEINHHQVETKGPRTPLEKLSYLAMVRMGSNSSRIVGNLDDKTVLAQGRVPGCSRGCLH